MATSPFRTWTKGYYQIRGIRAGFAEARSGPPVLVVRDGVQTVALRLKRLGMITGRMLDENHTGMPGVPVVVYSTGVPRQILGSATSDDLGVYRITGLPLGKYLVRTGAARLDGGLSIVPTYHPFSSVPRSEARTVHVELDAETTDIDIAPVAGSLASLSVRVTGCLGVAKVTLASDTGRKQTVAPYGQDPIVFAGLVPGDYEVHAEGEANQRKLAGFMALQVYAGGPAVEVNVAPLIDVKFRVNNGAGGPAVGDAGIVLCPYDLAGEGTPVPLTSDRLQLAPGYWQIGARPPGRSYLSEVKIDNAGLRRTRRDPDPDWFEFLLAYPVQANVAVSPDAAQLAGQVTMDGGKSAIGAPVYLLATTPQTRQRMNGMRVSHTSKDGAYLFEGLAPGTYLVLSGFDAGEVSEEAFAARGAQTVTLQEGRGSTLSLKLEAPY